MESVGMLKLARNISLAIYGVIGVMGWYQYDSLFRQINTVSHDG